MPNPDTTTITVPAWVKDLGKYLLALVPIVFGFWLAMHDLQRDFALEQEKVTRLSARVVELEAADHEDDLIRERMTADLTYIRQTMDGLKGTLDLLAAQ